MTDDRDRDPDRDQDRSGGLFDSLRDLLDALEAADRKREEGSLGEGSTRIDYDVDVSVGLDAGDGSRDRSRWTPGRRPGAKQGRNDNRDRNRDGVVTSGADDPDYHVDVVERDGVTELRADLPGVDDDDLRVSMDGGDAVVTVDDEVVERVPLAGDGAEIAETTFNNGVLTVVVRDRGEES